MILKKFSTWFRGLIANKEIGSRLADESLLELKNADINVAGVIKTRPGYRRWEDISSAILRSVYLKPEGFKTDTDGFLTSPEDDYDTVNNFVPCAEGGLSLQFWLNGQYWYRPSAYSYIGQYKVFSGGSQENPGWAGIYFKSSKIGGVYWNWFAASDYDGLKTFYLPQNANEDTEGGFFQYYYKYDAWYYAFNGTQHDIRFAQNGSVYKDTITDGNLVVRWDGRIGPAGADVPEIFKDIQQFASNEVANPTIAIPASNGLPVTDVGFKTKIQELKYFSDIVGVRYNFVVTNGKIYTLLKDEDRKIWLLLNPTGLVELLEKEKHIKTATYLDNVFFNDVENNVYMYNAQQFSEGGWIISGNRFIYFADNLIYVRSFSDLDDDGESITIENVPATNPVGTTIYNSLISIGFDTEFGAFNPASDCNFGFCIKTGDTITGYDYYVLSNGKNEAATGKCYIVKFNDRFIAQDYIALTMNASGEILSFGIIDDDIYIQCTDGRVEKIDISTTMANSPITTGDITGTVAPTSSVAAGSKKQYTLVAKEDTFYLATEDGVTNNRSAELVDFFRGLTPSNSIVIDNPAIVTWDWANFGKTLYRPAIASTNGVLTTWNYNSGTSLFELANQGSMGVNPADLIHSKILFRSFFSIDSDNNKLSFHQLQGQISVNLPVDLPSVPGGIAISRNDVPYFPTYDREPIFVTLPEEGVLRKFTFFWGWLEWAVSGGQVWYQDFSIGTKPTAIVEDDSKDYFWISDYAEGTVLKVDVLTKNILQTIDVDQGPVALAVDSSYVWVCNEQSNTVSRINKSSGSADKTYAVSGSPFKIFSNGTKVFVSNSTDNIINVINISTEVITGIEAGDHPMGIFFEKFENTGADFLYVANRDSGNVSIFDTVDTPVSTYYSNYVLLMAFSKDNGNFALDTFPGFLRLADISSFDSLAPLALKNTVSPGKLYVSAYESPKVENDYWSIPIPQPYLYENKNSSEADYRVPVVNDSSERFLLSHYDDVTSQRYYRISPNWLWPSGSFQQDDFTNFKTFNSNLSFHILRRVQELGTADIDQIRAIGTPVIPIVATDLDDLSTASTFLHKLLLKYFFVFVFYDNKTTELSPATEEIEIPQVNTIYTFTTNYAVDANQLTCAGHPFSDGDIVRLSSTTTLPTPLEADKNYWVLNSVAGTSIEVEEVSGSGTPVTLTDDGTGTHSVWAAIQGIKVVISNVNLNNALNQAIYDLADVLEIHIYRMSKEGWDSSAEWTEPIFLAKLEKTESNDWYYKENEKTIVSMINATDQVEVTGHGYSLDDRVIFIEGTGILPLNVSTGTMYYVQNVVDVNNFKIATTKGAGSPLDFGSDGSGALEVTRTYNEETYEDNVYPYSTYNPFTKTSVRSFGCKDIVIHKNRLVLIGYIDVENRSVILHSDVGNTEAIPLTNFRTIQSGDGEELVGGVSVADFLFLFKPSKIYGILGDTPTGQLVDVSFNIGTEYRRTIVAYNNVVYFMNRTGFFMIGNNTVQEIKYASLHDYFDETESDCIDFENCPDNAFGYIDKKNQEVHFHVPIKVGGDSQTRNNLDIVYDIKLNLFKTYEYANKIFTREQFQGVISGSPYYVMSNYSGDIFQVDISLNDLGAGIIYTIKTKAFNVDDEIVRKSFNFIKVFGENINTATIKYDIDEFEETGVTTYREIGTSSNYEGLTVITNNRGFANRIIVEITGGSLDDAPVKLEEIIIGYENLVGVIH